MTMFSVRRRLGRLSRPVPWAVVLMVLGLGLDAPVLAQTRETTRASTTASGTGASGGKTFGVATTSEGRYVAFFSEATNLVTGDTNAVRDVFVKDRLTGTIKRVSVATDGTQANGSSGDDFLDYPRAAISSDGRYVAFTSGASNLVTGDANGVSDVFLRDLSANTTTRVSTSSSSAELDNASGFPAISSDGAYVSFVSYAGNAVSGAVAGRGQVYRKKLATGALDLVTGGSGSAVGNGGSGQSAMSADGRYVAFESDATNLVSESDTNNDSDVFVRDMSAGVTVRVSVATDGSQTFPGSSYKGAFFPSISGSGRFVAFTADRDLKLVSDDTNGVADVYVRDRDSDGNNTLDEAGKVRTFRVSVATDGTQGGDDGFVPSISYDGRIVAFESFATNLIGGDTNAVADIFVRDLDVDGNNVLDESGKVATLRVSVDTGGAQANAINEVPVLTPDGRFVVFDSKASNLAADTNGDWDVYVHDRLAITVTTLSGGIEPALSGNGRFLAFESTDAAVVTGDTNGAADVFVRDRVANTAVRISLSAAGVQGNGGSFRPAINSNGRYVAFESDATNLVPGDTNVRRDVFLRDRDADGNGIFDEAGGVTTTLVSGSVSGAFGRGASVSPAVSADGAIIAFASDAANLVFGDTNGLRDIFVRVRGTGAVTRVNLGASGLQASGGQSDRPALSGNGRYVVFASDATNLVTGDTNGVRDVFIRDRSGNTTDRLSVNADGSQATSASDAPSISEDASLIAFQSTAPMVSADTNGVSDIYLRSRSASTTTRASVTSTGAQADGASSGAVISGDGAFVAFTSAATNLVAGDTNAVDDVFVLERATGLVRRASVVGNSQGDARSFDATLSADGRTVAFSTESAALQLVAAELLGSGVRSADGGTPVVIVQAPPASVNSVTPGKGPTDGGTVVEIKGQSLTGITTVRFGGTAVPVFSVITPTSMTVTTPAHAAGKVDVQIVGQVASTIFPGGFTYDAAPPPCTIALSSSTTSLTKTAGTASLTVDTQAGCAWAATTPVDWITFQESSAGSGPGSLQLAIAENTNDAARDGKVIVNETTFTISQEGGGCKYVIGPPSLRREVGAGSGTDDGVTITTSPGCSWKASADVSWLKPPADGKGSATVLYSIDANPTSFDRTGQLDVQGTKVRVTQLAPAAPATCTYSFTPATATVTSPGGPASVTINAGGTCPWTAKSDVDWITLTGTTTGTGNGTVSFTVAANAGGNRTGTIDVAATKYTVTELGAAGTKPFGVADTPADNQTGITGSLAITGWALDDGGVTSVDITRDGVPGESAPNYYIGRATLIRGARPDIVAAYPGVPSNDRAGWGYLLLTNQLPNFGNGTYKLHITATDAGGNTVEIATRTITCTNAAATVPFGAIDTPEQGQTIAGVDYVNFGWTLTPLPKTVPKNGSTIAVFVDGVNLGSPAYGFYRADVATLFPGLNNSSGPVGFYQFDTRVLPDGVHTIAWVATDDAGAATGIGSRFFTIANGSSLRTAVVAAPFDAAQDRSFDAAQGRPSWDGLALLPVNHAPLGVRRILGSPAGLSVTTPDQAGVHAIALAPLDIVHVAVASAGDPVEGYALANGRVEDLPIGSTLDPESGTFAWQLAPGFHGTYDFVFVRVHEGIRERVNVRVSVNPAGQ